MSIKKSLNEQVQNLLDRLVETGEEVGLQVAAYVDGELVVDAWAGLADEVTGRAVNGEDTTTVRQALAHSAGIPHMPAGATTEMMIDWEAMCAAIAASTPLWPPGTKVSYHALTFGWIIGEIVRRVDGRPIAQFAREELCQPLGIEDFYLGLPDAVAGRVALLREEPEPVETATEPNELDLLVMPPHLTTAEVFNRSDVRRASIPGAGGIMNARAIARHYAMLAGGGMLAGVRILSAERIDLMRALQTDAHDELFGEPNRKGLGYMLGGDEDIGGVIAMGRAGDEFGHPGKGGSLGFADPSRKLGFGLTKNLMKAKMDSDKTAAYLAAETIRHYLEQTDPKGLG